MMMIDTGPFQLGASSLLEQPSMVAGWSESRQCVPSLHQCIIIAQEDHAEIQNKRYKTDQGSKLQQEKLETVAITYRK